MSIYYSLVNWILQTGDFDFLGLKVINSSKNLFCYLAQICNLVPEFNGLVSKRVGRKIGPFFFSKIFSLFHPFLSFLSFRNHP